MLEIKIGLLEPEELSGLQAELDFAEAREEYGDWLEEVKPMRTIEASLEEVSQETLASRDAAERVALQQATQLSEVSSLDSLSQKAVVRHYAGVPSALIDVSTDPEVAAFFASNGSHVRTGQIGALWAIDLNLMATYLKFKIDKVGAVQKITLSDNREAWGVNKEILEDLNLPPIKFEIISVELPFKRPQAQKGKFLSILADDGSPLEARVEMTWWSLIERWSYMCAFIQDGTTYENPKNNILRQLLLPEDEPVLKALGISQARGNH